MPELIPPDGHGFIARREQPLIGVPVADGDESVRYFTDEAEAEATLPLASVQHALSLLGAWSDLDWEQAEDELDQIRHSNPPTPPISL
jgi:hypothetical protein